jgi:hypothetical protein
VAGTSPLGVTSIEGEILSGQLLKKAKVSSTVLDITGTVDPGNIFIVVSATTS